MTCDRCGANLALVGTMHRCMPRPVMTVPEPRPSVASPNASDASPNSYARNARWREKHRDRYNAGMRDLMRRKRASENSARPAA